ncbi:MAG TPA: hypothetical protein VK031_02225 [Tissierellaceae bacterium]|nr:hypothetical protein [Tissierellaceae bacterium]
MKTKLRVLSESDGYQIKLVDDTGFQNQYNLEGYKETPEMVEYVFEVFDEVRRELFTFNETDVEPYMNRVVKTLEMDKLFKDSLYKITMYSVFDIGGVGDGFEGLSFISNVSGAESIYNNYTAIKAGDYVYQIVGRSGDVLLLDRDIVEDFEEFMLVIHSSDKVALLSEIEDSIMGVIRTLGSCKCKGKVDKVAELQLYKHGIELAVESSNYGLAEELLGFMTDVSGQLKGCSRC